MHEEQEKLERRAGQWLAGTLSWEMTLQTLRVRADLAPTDRLNVNRVQAGVDGPAVIPRRDRLVAVSASARPDVAGWNERLDRTA